MGEPVNGQAGPDRVAVLGAALRDNGYRLTAARQAILEVLVERNGHISADELARIVRRRQPGVGRMTIYRTLDLLSELGLIRAIYQGTGAAHYILMEDGRHHHFVCTQCYAVIEFDDCLLREVEQVLARRHQFTIEGHLLEIYGRCQACRSPN